MTADAPLVLNVETHGSASLQLADQEKTTLRFPVKVSADCGFASSIIRLFLKGEGIALERDWKLGIRPAYPAIARKVRKVLGAEGSEASGSGAEVSGQGTNPPHPAPSTPHPSRAENCGICPSRSRAERGNE